MEKNTMRFRVSDDAGFAGVLKIGLVLEDVRGLKMIYVRLAWMGVCKINMRQRKLYGLVDELEEMRIRFCGSGYAEKAAGVGMAISRINTLLREDTEDKIRRGRARLDRMEKKLNSGRYKNG